MLPSRDSLYISSRSIRCWLFVKVAFTVKMDAWPCFASSHLEPVVCFSDVMWRWPPANLEMDAKFYGVENSAMVTSGVDYDGHEVPGRLAANLYHMGMGGKISRSTLADASVTCDWRIRADFAQVLLA